MVDNDDIKHFGNNLKARRTARSWTQDDLAERALLNPKYVGEMERGDRNPSLDVICRLARALDVDVAELVGDELTRLDRPELLRRVASELELKPNEELRAWLRVARATPR
jgi:transcriptional regulator with XRE-family HTH domain